MSLEDIPRVSIEHCGEYRFIQVEGPEERHYVYGQRYKNNSSVPLTSHKAIFEGQFLEKIKESGLNPEDFRCIGGGFINILEDKKQVFISEASGDYGAFDCFAISLLEKYITKNFKGYSIKIEDDQSIV